MNAETRHDPWCPECEMPEMHDGPGGPIVIRHNPSCTTWDALADAWDRGFRAGESFANWVGGEPRNPYRRDQNGGAA